MTRICEVVTTTAVIDGVSGIKWATLAVASQAASVAPGKPTAKAGVKPTVEASASVP